MLECLAHSPAWDYLDWINLFEVILAGLVIRDWSAKLLLKATLGSFCLEGPETNDELTKSKERHSKTKTHSNQINQQHDQDDESHSTRLQEV